LTPTSGDALPRASGPRTSDAGAATRLPRGVYEAELLRLQGELVTMQEWVRAEDARVVVLFEGRDAAGRRA